MSAAAGPTATPLIGLRAVHSGNFSSTITFTFTAFHYTLLTGKYVYEQNQLQLLTYRWCISLCVLHRLPAVNSSRQVTVLFGM